MQINEYDLMRLLLYIKLFFGNKSIDEIIYDFFNEENNLLYHPYYDEYEAEDEDEDEDEDEYKYKNEYKYEDDKIKIIMI